MEYGQNNSGSNRPQSVDGMLVNGASAVVDECTAEQSSKREQQQVILRVSLCTHTYTHTHTHTHTTILRPFFWDHPREPMPEENFWTLRCKGRLTEADIATIRLGATPSGLSRAHLHHPPCFLQAGCPSCRQTDSVKALKASVYDALIIINYCK